MLTLPHPQPHHICDDVYSAYDQMFSSVVPVAHATRPEYGLPGLFLVRWQQGRMRCNSFICFIAAASSEAGTPGISGGQLTVIRMSCFSDIPTDIFLFRLVIKDVAGRYSFCRKSLSGERRAPQLEFGWLYDRCRSVPGLILTIFSFVLHYVIFVCLSSGRTEKH